MLVASLVLLVAAAAGLVVLAARGGRDAGYAVVPLAPAPPPGERELRQRLDDLTREVGELRGAVAAPPATERELRQRLDDLTREVGELRGAVAAPPATGPSVSSSGGSTPAAGETPRAATTAPDLSAAPSRSRPGGGARGLRPRGGTPATRRAGRGGGRRWRDDRSRAPRPRP